MVARSLASLEPDPLALDPAWPSPVPLVSLDQALRQTVLRRGISREDLLKGLGRSLHHRIQLPLLWLLPPHWRLAPAQVPARLRSLADLLEAQLLSPALLHALVDELPGLMPGQGRGPSALERWSAETLGWGGATLPLPGTIAALAAAPPPDSPEAPPTDRPIPPGGGVRFRNTGLPFLQSEPCRRRNALLAQVFNRLAANLLSARSWSLEGSGSSRELLKALQGLGWRVRARLRSSVASFGMGASLPLPAGGWAQVPLALPLRTGLLEPAERPAADLQEQRMLLPHSCLELELAPPGQPESASLLLQYYQGTEGLCGWEGLNDLQRPWQNDRCNGTVRYFDAPFDAEELLELLDLCDVVALLHNVSAAELGLPVGGYGSLGFCIDSTALLQQAMRGRCSLFPILLSGIWRERLRRSGKRLRQQVGAGRWSEGHQRALERHDRALETLPLDLSILGKDAAAEAARRIRSSAPASSPFRLSCAD